MYEEISEKMAEKSFKCIKRYFLKAEKNLAICRRCHRETNLDLTYTKIACIKKIEILFKHFSTFSSEKKTFSPDNSKC